MTTQHRSESVSSKSVSTQRLEALIDGAFAIVLTLLAVEVEVPAVASENELLRSLLTLGPRLFSYLFSFFILGIFWFGHQMESQYIRRTDRVHLWLNLIFLATVAMIPFSASLLGTYPLSRVTVIVYSSNILIIGLVRYVDWRYATNSRRLVDTSLNPQLIRSLNHTFLWTPISCCLAILLSFFNVVFSLALLILMPMNVAFRIAHLFHRHSSTE